MSEKFVYEVCSQIQKCIVVASNITGAIEIFLAWHPEFPVVEVKRCFSRVVLIEEPVASKNSKKDKV